MPVADYRCRECRRVFELDAAGNEQRHVHDRHPMQRRLCRSTTVQRVWGPISVGAGTSGGTPAHTARKPKCTDCGLTYEHCHCPASVRHAQGRPSDG